MPAELFPQAPIASVHALFDEDDVAPNPRGDVCETLWDADVITAVDHMTRRESVVYGRGLLREIRASDRPKWVRVIRVGVDLGTDELPRLLAVVQAVKGRHDCRRGAGASDR